jgi:Uma2 family endonuclease
MQAVLEVMETPAATARDSERSYEFVDGEWKEKEMPGAKHSGVCGRLLEEFAIYLRGHRIACLCPEASFQIGKRERVPDLALVRLERIPPAGEPEPKWTIPPDIAIEIISPSDLDEEVQDKVDEYLAAGVKQVWLVRPKQEIITIYRSRTNIIAFPGDSELLCEDLLPGFHCKLQDIFQLPTASPKIN